VKEEKPGRSGIPGASAFSGQRHQADSDYFSLKDSQRYAAENRLEAPLMLSMTSHYGAQKCNAKEFVLESRKP